MKYLEFLSDYKEGSITIALSSVGRDSASSIISSIPCIKSRDLRRLTIKILKGLGENGPESLLRMRIRKYRCQNRDVAIFALYQLGVYLNKEIGGVFGVGYTAIPGAVKRGQEYLRSDRQLEGVINEIISDI